MLEKLLQTLEFSITDFDLKCSKYRSAAGLHQEPLESLQSSSENSSWIKGTTLCQGEEGKGKKGKGKGRKGREGKGGGREGEAVVKV